MLYVFGRQFRRTKRINVFKFKESKSHHTPDITIRERNQNEVHNSVSNFADKTLTLRLEMINNIMKNYRIYKLTHQWIGWIRDVDICFSLKDIYHYIHVTLWNLKKKKNFFQPCDCKQSTIETICYQLFNNAKTFYIIILLKKKSQKEIKLDPLLFISRFSKTYYRYCRLISSKCSLVFSIWTEIR